jgi:hypothetical protein
MKSHIAWDVDTREMLNFHKESCWYVQIELDRLTRKEKRKKKIYID